MVMTPGSPPNPPGAPQVDALACPNCGAPLTVRSLGRAVTIVCEHCYCFLDAKDPRLRILQRFHDATEREVPLIPLGSRGKWRGADYVVIGFQVRAMVVDDISYNWREYLLFSPYKGFRYLTEYDGHWNDASVVTALPEVEADSARYLGKKYKQFQTCSAKTIFALGEFPWQLSVDDSVEVTDYIAPPFVLSSETAGNETTWTLGEYVYGADIWKAFNLAGLAPTPVGVYENQPSGLRASAGQIWFVFAGLFTAIFAIFTVNQFLSKQEQVFQESYLFSPSSATEPSFVTPEFELKGRTSSVEVKTDTDASNQWLYLSYALIDENTGQAYDFGREVSYYSGVDSDGRWEEGSPHDRVVLPSIPPGRYYLRIEPESDARSGSMRYSVTVTRDVPVLGIYLVALAAILLPALLISWRTYNFEQMRWAESDHPMKSFGGGQ
jgi:hypothetical protein